MTSWHDANISLEKKKTVDIIHWVSGEIGGTPS
jgi:hypothetical protein